MTNDTIKDSLISLAIESWRFTRVYLRLLSKLDADDQKRFTSQYLYFKKQLEDKLKDMGLKIVNIEGLPFDPGMAATAINVGDFQSEDKLVVDQMLEPIIMDDNGVIKMGTAILRRV